MFLSTAQSHPDRCLKRSPSPFSFRDRLRERSFLPPSRPSGRPQRDDQPADRPWVSPGRRSPLLRPIVRHGQWRIC